MNKVLYMGGFEMPDKNAAAQRVLSIAKTLREIGYRVQFFGITKSGDYQGTVDGFKYEARDYPSSKKDWIKYAIGARVTSYIGKERPNIVITYNYPAVAQERVIGYCRRHNIKVVGDITEWYQSNSIIKKIDTALRMRLSNRHLDGIIAISKYLYEFYNNRNTIYVPPVVDISEDKWNSSVVRNERQKVKLIYVGSPGIGKDRLDYIINGIRLAGPEHFDLDIVGIDKDQYVSIYGGLDDISALNLSFHGRLPHKEAVSLLLQSDFQIFFRNNIRVNKAGFPTKFVESVSAGIPVITNRVSNVSDYIVNGVNGFLINYPVEEEISAILKQVSLLSEDEIVDIKNNVERNQFDYHCILLEMQDFISNLKL